MSALPEDCKGVVSPVVFPSAGSTSTSSNTSISTISSIVAGSDGETSEAPQVVANADAAFLASPAGQELLAQARAMAGSSRHIVVVLTPQLANHIAAGTLVNVASPVGGSITLGQYCQMANGNLANVLAVSAGGGAMLLMLDVRGKVTAVDCLLPATASPRQTSPATGSTPSVTTTTAPAPVTTGPVSAPGRANSVGRGPRD